MAVDGYTDVLFLLCFYIISAIVLIVGLLADSYVVLYCSLLIKVCTLQVTKGYVIIGLPNPNFFPSNWVLVRKILKQPCLTCLQKEIQVRQCLWNGMPRQCYLFARKFLPETLDNLMQLFSNYTTI